MIESTKVGLWALDAVRRTDLALSYTIFKVQHYNVGGYLLLNKTSMDSFSLN